MSPTVKSLAQDLRTSWSDNFERLADEDESGYAELDLAIDADKKAVLAEISALD